MLRLLIAFIFCMVGLFQPDAMSRVSMSGIASEFGNGKYQTIDVSKLNNLEAVNEHGPHVSIRPKDDPTHIKLGEWAATRNTDNQHQYTKELKEAIVCH